jgi:MoxR-like ATPase
MQKREVLKMSANISIQQLNTLRDEFKLYLREKYTDWSDSTVSTISSDAFFALNNNVGVDFWASLISEESLLIARDKIHNFLESTKGSERSEERANGYLSALRHLKGFLDEKHPTLTKDWSGKAVSNVNLKSDFQSWMKKQKKNNGESYSPNTINAYTSALKNSTAKLNLGDAVYSDLFYYTSADEFEEAHKIILDAPNFEEIDASASNHAYSSGMIIYSRFLRELGEPSAWIFQGNPKYYDVEGAIKALDKITWAVNQSPKQIKKSDKVYIWLSGSDGGIIAAGTILCNPEIRQPETDDPYSRGESLKTEPYLAVDIRIDHRLDTVISRAILLADERTKRLEIITFPGATNFRVTKAQEEVIESIINGSYQRVPAISTPAVEVVDKKRYWLYAPGENARLWESFSHENMIGIGWDDLGDLRNFTTKEDIKAAMKKIWGEDKTYKNDGHALWQFANEMNPGDIIFAKRGLSVVIGRGIVKSSYIFDSSRSEYRHIHKVQWTHKGEWEHPGQAAMKTLTDITPYTEYVQKLEALFSAEQAGISDDEPEIRYPDYSEQDFLGEVYMSQERYATLKGLLLRKKNIILQGAPGVGKTFAAQRLAFSVMGEKDISRVKVVQFHQSYSYEDFVIGYRPDGTNFKLTVGPFYEFCKRAEEDDERPYFFVIDEINRGNLSKIFGELLMLIENDKRGEKYALRLLYADEQFSVPANVQIIGMMNTADRSLAMIDYALRRRFAFFDMEPAFQSEGFTSYKLILQNPKFDSLITTVELLNKAITDDAALGGGFRIGHSYFCTSEIVNDEWLHSLVEYELIPLLQEYWFDEPSKKESWSLRLRGAIRG